jgi:hypothetical protein
LVLVLVLVPMLMLVLALMLLRLGCRGLLRERWLLLGIVRVSRGIPLVVCVMGSSHTVQHGMTAEIVRSKLDHCRHWGRVPQIGVLISLI